ncbi:MAG: phosphatase PAP2 family protein [Planctomycetota bacterium]|jgi:membrane-associated phospholipid phosphatase
MKKKKTSVILGLAVMSVLFTGCGTLENGRGWGQDIVVWPDGKRLRNAAWNALRDPRTIIPAVGAGVFAVEEFDKNVSNWATKCNPIFGSEDAARDWSDDLRWALRGEAVFTALATPSGDDAGTWIGSKFDGGLVEFGAWGATKLATCGLKHCCGRTRPNRSNDRSFPSGHSSESFSLATLANRNIDYIRLEKVGLGEWRRPLKCANLLLASGVAWARVEGRKHYPSDVLAGAALGNFLTAFIHDAFLNLPETRDVAFQIAPHEDGAMLQVAFAF